MLTNTAADTSRSTRNLLMTHVAVVSFAEYRLFYRALLQKRPMILRSLLIVATPCQKTVSNAKKSHISFCQQMVREWGGLG